MKDAKFNRLLFAEIVKTSDPETNPWPTYNTIVAALDRTSVPWTTIAHSVRLVVIEK